MISLKIIAPLAGIVCLAVVGCATIDSKQIQTTDSWSNNQNRMASQVNTALPVESGSSSSVEFGYMCPDLFEGHIFSCPTIPVIGLAADFNTDAIGGSLELSCKQNHGGICLSPAVEYSRGSESYRNYGDLGTQAKQQGGFSGDTDYSVIQARVQGKYGFPMSADSSLTLSPVAGPRIYRWSAIDCPFTSGCTETLFVLDVGVSVQYKNFGIDATTGLNGPNFAARLKYYLGR